MLRPQSDGLLPPTPFPGKGRTFLQIPLNIWHFLRNSNNRRPSLHPKILWWFGAYWLGFWGQKDFIYGRGIWALPNYPITFQKYVYRSWNWPLTFSYWGNKTWGSISTISKQLLCLATQYRIRRQIIKWLPTAAVVCYHLFTYSMVQSPSWEANWFAASQEIPRILWNPKVRGVNIYMQYKL